MLLTAVLVSQLCDRNVSLEALDLEVQVPKLQQIVLEGDMVREATPVYLVDLYSGALLDTLAPADMGHTGA